MVSGYPPVFLETQKTTTETQSHERVPFGLLDLYFRRLRPQLHQLDRCCPWRRCHHAAPRYQHRHSRLLHQLDLSGLVGLVDRMDLLCPLAKTDSKAKTAVLLHKTLFFFNNSRVAVHSCRKCLKTKPRCTRRIIFLGPNVRCAKRWHGAVRGGGACDDGAIVSSTIL